MLICGACSDGGLQRCRLRPHVQRWRVRPADTKAGLGIDNIVSARLLLSTGEAIDASSTENPDVFEAICGGGQALGIVSELRIATYRLAETMGSADGSFLCGTVAFPADRAADVADMLENLKVAPEMVMDMFITIPQPGMGLPLTAPMLIFMLGCLGPDSQADAAFADIHVLGLAASMSERVSYAEMNNWNDVFQEPGGFKRLFGVGLEKISSQSLTELTKQIAGFLTKGPDVSKTRVLFTMLGWRS